MGAVEIDGAEALRLARRVRESRPLVHHLTNQVTMDQVALLTRALGASPIMARAPQEVEELAAAADCLCLNLGTPDDAALEAMRLALGAAEQAGVPVVLDPVGAGTTAYRTAAARQLLGQGGVTVVRGNAGEVAALLGEAGGMRGVESRRAAGPELALRAARALGGCLAVTGEVDFVAQGERLLAVEGGHPLLAETIGSGCLATAAVACFLAVEPDPLRAAAAALACFASAAELAAREARGPAELRLRLVDLLHALPGELARGVRVRAEAPA